MIQVTGAVWGVSPLSGVRRPVISTNVRRSERGAMTSPARCAA